MSQGWMSAPDVSSNARAGKTGSWLEVLAAFLKLGLTSFGGPIAHLGYFRDELVLRRRWIDEAGFADLVALCQFLPGPASSQVGFALGLLRGGALGALAAWSAFTLPSALLLIAFAFGVDALRGPLGSGLIHGLKVVAVAVVAQAVWGMARTLTPDRERSGIAVGAILLIVFAGGSVGQISAIALGGLAGMWLCRGAPAATTGHLTCPFPRWVAVAAISLFVVLLLLTPALAAATGWQALALFDAFYRAGALVFGGGHVVLPLLQAEVVAPGWISHDAFLSGYGARRRYRDRCSRLPLIWEPSVRPEPNGVTGAAVALAAVFLPGLLLVLGALPFWDAFRTRPIAQAAMRGANAAVVGILGAALYSPVFTTAILDLRDFALALVGFVLLTVWHAPPWVVVALSAAAGAALQGF